MHRSRVLLGLVFVITLIACVSVEGDRPNTLKALSVASLQNINKKDSKIVPPEAKKEVKKIAAVVAQEVKDKVAKEGGDKKQVKQFIKEEVKKLTSKSEIGNVVPMLSKDKN